MKKLILLTSAAVLAASLSSHGQVATSFDTDLSPDAQGFAVNSTAALTLTYTIDGTGGIALNANATTGGGARWNQIDNSAAGTTSSASLFNTAFTLTYSGSANAILTNKTNYGNVGTGSYLSTQGQGNGNALENGEYIAFTVSGTATAVSGFSLDLVDFSFANRLGTGGSSFGVNDNSNNFIERKIPNTSLIGTIDSINGTIAGTTVPGSQNLQTSIGYTGISLANGDSMTFRTDSDYADGGAALSGFNFTVSATAIPEPGSFALLGGLCALTAMALRRRRS
jgi:hypothetical protein|tara:strand:+ start:542 stop:1387 length:846 start_codon:yes stop_codon:yes gene_type:complete